ncbi:hypothetical protein ABZ869_31835, partial [Streptomyces sp. NPDC046928]|uniref:hypothetical protein n=1 Tax=Streptomyces sp. NPDC046928 TaxID=3155021 RepID=UPI0033DFD8DF
AARHAVRPSCPSAECFGDLPGRVHYPPHRATPQRQAAHSAPSPLTFVLLIAAPAIAAVAALRPR